MSVYYSASQAGFYDERIHAQIPDDALEISEADHVALILGQGGGKVIVADASGYPVLADYTPSDAALWAAYQATAQNALEDSDITLLRCYENGLSVPVAWVTYRAALRSILSVAQPALIPAELPSRPDYPAGS
jgi:hypothetical protein